MASSAPPAAAMPVSLLATKLFVPPAPISFRAPASSTASGAASRAD